MRQTDTTEKKAYMNFVYAYLKRHNEILNGESIEDVLTAPRGLSLFFDDDDHKKVHTALTKPTAPLDPTIKTIEKRFYLPVLYKDFRAGFKANNENYTIFSDRENIDSIITSNPLLSISPKLRTQHLNEELYGKDDEKEDSGTLLSSPTPDETTIRFSSNSRTIVDIEPEYTNPPNKEDIDIDKTKFLRMLKKPYFYLILLACVITTYYIASRNPSNQKLPESGRKDSPAQEPVNPASTNPSPVADTSTQVPDGVNGGITIGNDNEIDGIQNTGDNNDFNKK